MRQAGINAESSAAPRDSPPVGYLAAPSSLAARLFRLKDLSKVICAEVPTGAELAKDCNYDAQSLARMCGCSIRQLERAFHKVHTTPHHWLQEQQLWCELQTLEHLDATGHLDSIKRVAIECGYRHPGNFNRAFKKIFQMSPKAFLAEREKALKHFGIDLAACRAGRQKYPASG
jgi:AraC-like DNA-binding protein